MMAPTPTCWQDYNRTTIIGRDGSKTSDRCAHLAGPLDRGLRPGLRGDAPATRSIRADHGACPNGGNDGRARPDAVDPGPCPTFNCGGSSARFPAAGQGPSNAGSAL